MIECEDGGQRERSRPADLVLRDTHPVAGDIPPDKNWSLLFVLQSLLKLSTSLCCQTKVEWVSFVLHLRCKFLNYKGLISAKVLLNYLSSNGTMKAISKQETTRNFMYFLPKFFDVLTKEALPNPTQPRHTGLPNDYKRARFHVHQTRRRKRSGETCNSELRTLPLAAMASVHSTVAPRSFLPSISKPKPKAQHVKSVPKTQNFPATRFSRNRIFSGNKQAFVANSAEEEFDVISVQSADITDQQEGVVVSRVEVEGGDGELVTQVSGFGTNEGLLSLEGFSSSSSPSSSALAGNESEEKVEKLIDRTINATIVLVAGSFAITKLLTIDSDYWHGWTLYEILRYAPQHNWSAYEEALKTNPVFAKMVISGVVYSVGDWIAQCFEGKPLFEFDRARMFRSGLVGFTLHGSLSHYYYQFCEELFPYKEWWVVPAKVAFDQTAWSAVWNSIYYTVVGFLRFDSPISIFNELRATFFPMLTAGWKLWPFAHLITYGVVPVEQRLLWVDIVELVWVTILSTFSNEKSEARKSEPVVPIEVKSTASVNPPEE
ncbi:hypothetical protein VNO77_28296 [Canavalia gladiata]|uniref:Peroxisomal membrane protein 2 n=1 Tax=Canavalia gladiata TaxID=3824 RepID=A0AAN9KVD0_CANGL